MNVDAVIWPGGMFIVDTVFIDVYSLIVKWMMSGRL